MNNPLSSYHLQAFQAVAVHQHFSKAAQSIGITQSALTLRIQALEERIAETLFVRGRGGVSLTEAGQTLLRYAKQKDELEAEALNQITPRGKNSPLAGTLRIGGFSSVMRSVVLPALSPILKRNPALGLTFVSKETYQLPAALRSGEIDFMILDRKLESESIECVELGEERYVFTHAKGVRFDSTWVLDHDESDETTSKFFQAQKKKHSPLLKRRFMDDVYGIKDGVRLGLGCAVLPAHLIQQDARIAIDPSYKPLIVPLYLHTFRQPYLTRLNQAILGEGVTSMRSLLAKATLH